jgi:hypothetical protein
MKLHLEATPAELAELSIDELTSRIERVSRMIAEVALTEGLSKAKGERADTPAEPHERVRGSKKNPKGSARSRTSGAKIKVTKQIEDALRDKVKAHNEKAKHKWQKVSLATLKSVFRRGAGAFSASHRPSQNRQSWAYARVNAFLKIAMGGGNPKFVQDNDLLHDSHPRNKAKKSVDLMSKAQGGRGGEVDLVLELAEQASNLYMKRLSALAKDIEALADRTGGSDDKG